MPFKWTRNLVGFSKNVNYHIRIWWHSIFFLWCAAIWECFVILPQQLLILLFFLIIGFPEFTLLIIRVCFAFRLLCFLSLYSPATWKAAVNVANVYVIPATALLTVPARWGGRFWSICQRGTSVSRRMHHLLPSHNNHHRLPSHVLVTAAFAAITAPASAVPGL